MTVNSAKFKVFPSVEKTLINESCCAGTPLVWFNVVAPFCCCSLCSTCPSSGGWFSTTVCLSEFWRSVRVILWVHKFDEVITWALVFPDIQTDGYAFTGQEEHRLHARAALPVRPHGRFYPQVCGPLSCCGVTEGCLQDQWGPTGTNLCFILFLCVFLNGFSCFLFSSLL